MRKEANIISSPSTKTWEELYKAAIEFKEIGAWNWMWDSDVFGVKNPVNGEIGYCCVLGGIGEFFALAIYLGTEGLSDYLRVQSGEIDVDNKDALYLKKCLVASFGDRKFLSKDDLRVIKKLGLLFRGRNAWPLFKSYQPGYHPWYLTEEEATYLILCLKQAKEVALRFKEAPKMLNTSKDNHYFVRIPKKEGETLEWMDAWLEPPPPLKKMVIMVKEMDESRLKRIEKTASRQEMIWEIDFFHFPACVEEKGGRPYYPLAFLWVDQDSYYILHTYLTTPKKYRIEFIEQFLHCLEKVKILPAEILVKKGELFSYLCPFTERLNIKLSLVEELDAIEEARNDMVEYFDKGKS